MIKRSVIPSGRPREYEVLAGAWVAIAILVVMTVSTWPSGGTNSEDPPFWASSTGWGAGTLSVAAVVWLMTAVAVQDVRATRRDGTPEPIRAPRLGLALATCAWFLGGLFCLLTFFYVQADVCGGGDAWSFGCRNRSGPLLNVLGLVFAASATPALVVLTMPANRTRLSRWLAPALIVGLYLLALRMWVPHVGLGVPSREELMP